ncbi:phage tail terminator protein [Escherichia coli]|uniref:phage tail terminator protein n=1 Tax=Escherichia coli TaxID=562 RepID=UPI00390A1947
MVAPLFFDEADFPAVAVYLTGAEYTGEELDSDTWQAGCISKFSCLLRCGFRAGCVDRSDLSGDERLIPALSG